MLVADGDWGCCCFPQRSVSENSLVAMDFSGRTGRVIDNPVEAQSAAMEEGQTWRVRRRRLEEGERGGGRGGDLEEEEEERENGMTCYNKCLRGTDEREGTRRRERSGEETGGWW